MIKILDLEHDFEFYHNILFVVFWTATINKLYSSTSLAFLGPFVKVDKTQNNSPQSIQE